MAALHGLVLAALPFVLHIKCFDALTSSHGHRRELFGLEWAIVHDLLSQELLARALGGRADVESDGWGCWSIHILDERTANA